MTTTKGYAAPSVKEALIPYSFQRRTPGNYDVSIDIKYCGICHSDIHQARNEWGGSIYPMVPGHEIVGVVSQIGSKVSLFKVGDKVGVGCFVDSCRRCPSCEAGIEQYCYNHLSSTYNGTEQDKKTPTYGGYSSHMVVDENYVLHIPQNLSLDSAAPLLCAGITLYSPLVHWKAGPGKKVAIIGLGGLGHMGVKLGSAMGAEITVLSQSMKKSEDAYKFGAKYYYSTADEETFTKLNSSFDLILNTVSAELDLNKYLDLLKVDGTMVLIGVPETKAPLGASSLISGRRSLAGSLIGGIKETQEMLDFCGKHQITSDIELISAQKINEAYERVLKSDVRYRFVIDANSF